jgi:hypothetical protein
LQDGIGGGHRRSLAVVRAQALRHEVACDSSVRCHQCCASDGAA